MTLDWIKLSSFAMQGDLKLPNNFISVFSNFKVKNASKEIFKMHQIK